MERVGGILRLSATDLVGHLNCRHLTALDHAVAAGALERPQVWDPLLEILRERGRRHEAAYIAHLQSSGLEIIEIPGVGIDDASVAATLEAMRSGAEVIVQGALRQGRWVGRADVLRRVELPSDLGAWSYEPLDTKLAKETKAGAVLQLCLYADLLESTQGAAPERAYVVAPWTDFQPLAFRMADYAAYFRQVKRSLQSSLETPRLAETYPEPVEHCDVCRWSQHCDRQWREDDHLSLVAGATKVQIQELAGRGVATVSELATLPIPLPWRPERGSRESFERIREQARLQVAGREAGGIVYELLPLTPPFGLCQLPEPTDGDLFFDFEGDPFVGESGLEYLFGYAWQDDDGQARYTGDWALTREAERQALERFVDFVIARLERWPQLHIYHFAPYEPAALKRLMGRYATREDEVDRLLRGKVFVDLFAVTRRALRASVESYSIKRLEPLYGFDRDVPLRTANHALAKLQAFLELGDADALGEADREMVEGYNRDDCVSTWRLRDWLEARREELVAGGETIERPAPGAQEPGETVTAWLERITPVIAQLTAGVPDDPIERTDEQQGRWLLAYILDWHRREQKAVWWEYFRLSDLTSDDLVDERAAISGLEFVGAVGGTTRAPIHRYSFPAQEMQLRGGETLHAEGGAAFGTVEDLSIEARTVDIKKRGDLVGLHPQGVFSHLAIRVTVLQEALLRLASYVADRGLEGPGPYQAARDLILRVPPPRAGDAVQADGETPLAAALRLGTEMATGVLPIQGPPGTGKTYTAARMICRIVASGRTVAITANSHKVIRNLIDEVLRAAKESGADVSCLQKPDELETNLDGLTFTTDNAAVFAAIGQTCRVAGGTVWLWARPEAFECVDVLVVDEAAQMSLANVLAAAHCAKSVVLLGDPQQLEQPMQGSHPEGSDASALHHLLGGHETLPPDRGLFLAETWRLHPSICAFTSELFYEDRLHSRPGLELQTLRGSGPLIGSGLRFLPVPHEGNQNASPEEAQAVAELIEAVLAGSPTWIDRDGVEAPLTLAEILIMAPYNAQVFELQAHLPGGQIGTVDKFQGREKPLVIYSMTTSSPADAPRGMEFLYSLNRLNVATSRARCLCVLVGSPAALTADCRTPRQMQLANAFCRYLELAERV